MAFSKRVKTVLFILIGIYLIGITLFLVKVFTAEESAVKADAVKDLIALSERLHQEDPKAKVLSEKEAATIFDDAMLARGPVIVFNYTLFMQVLNFGILLVVLYGLFWGPLIGFLDARREKIRSDINSARERREKADERFRKAEDELRSTREERRRIIDSAQTEAEAEREERLEDARKEAEAMIERAKREIEAHVVAGKNVLRGEIARLSVMLAEKIIAREIRQEDHATLASQFIAEIERKAKEAEN